MSQNTDQTFNIDDSERQKILNERFSDTNTDLGFNERLEKYTEKVENNVELIIPVELRSKHCLIFGTRVLYHFDTFEEAVQKQSKLPLVTILYSPTK
jgi:hypothetical protein